MPTCGFRDLATVCKKLGLNSKDVKKGTVWEGISPLTGEPVRICVHDKAGGRDIPDGTFAQYIKDLGFKNNNAFKEFLNKC